ncbi:MAG TPA: LptF/LptG family permease [Sedimentisphaerales bacterium]|nr:LptF/LptG family permease [Sedimentisphaerales bacterium]
MVFTLHRYILRELLKVFVLAVVALTVMLSLGSILRPVQEYGVGPRQAVHLMVYFLPITLTFVLPIGALFAASLVYGRFASDNELDACKASGISLLTLVCPGLALAIVVAIANLILSFHVMPVFIHLAEQSFKADAKQILFRNIQRRGYYSLPPDDEYLLYADFANPQTDTLSGVVVVGLEDGSIKRIISTEHAKIIFNPHRRFSEVQITAHNTYQMDPDGSVAFIERLSLPTEFGSLLGDNIKFKKLDEMKKIRDVDLMLFDPIAKLARRTYAQLTTEVLAQHIRTKTAGAGQSTQTSSQMPETTGSFYLLYSGEKFVEFAATRCSVPHEKEIELSGDVLAVEYDAVVESGAVQKRLLRTFKCSRGLIRVEDDELSQTLTLELYRPTWQGPTGREEPALKWIPVRGLVVPAAVEAVTGKFRTGTGLNATELASASLNLHVKPSPKLTGLQQKLRKEIRNTLAEIEAEIQWRLAFGIGCVAMIMIGIGLGIALKGGHLLSAFGASCVPAAVLIICVMTGRNIAKNPGVQVISGTMLMWLGLALLVLLAAVIYRRLLRN